MVEGGDNIDPDRRDEVLREIQSFKLLVGIVEVNGPEGAKLYVDGALRGEIPLQGILRVAAGKHRFVLKMEDEVLLDGNFKVAGEEKLLLKANTQTDEANAAASDEGPESDSTETTENKPADASKMNGKTIAGIVTGVAGLAGAGVGVMFFMKGKDEFNTAEDQQDRTEYNKWNSEYEKHNAMGIALMAAGGALTVSGVVLLVLGLTDKGKSEEKSVAVKPALGGLEITF
jgi:hypothetical protein